MNAKKIMGAVLVALLAAALFVGAGAAAADKTDLGVLYTYVDLPSTFALNDVFAAEDGSASIAVQQLYMKNPSGTIVAAGTGFPLSETQFSKTTYYYNDTVKFKLAAPTATVYAVVDGKSVIDGEVDLGVTPTFSVGIDSKIANSVANSAIVFTTPAGAEVKYTGFDANTAGKWGAKVDLDGIVRVGGPEFSPVVYFTIVDKDAENTLTVKEESVIVSNIVLVNYDFTVAGQTLKYNKDYLTLVADQTSTTDSVNDGEVTVVGKKGTVAFTAKATGSTEITATVGGDSLSVAVEIVKGAITATAEANSYFLGSEIKLSGTSTVDGPFYIYIMGTNFDLQQIASGVTVKSDGTWSKTIKTADIVGTDGKKPDAGTYTLYIATIGNQNDIDDIGTYGTISVALKQPFISITEAPSVVVKDTVLTVKGTAEAATTVQYYIFGTNYFDFNTASVKKATTEFTIEYGKDKTKLMSSGQYFMVVQHPMYDGNFNIAPNKTGAIYLNTKATATYLDTLLFNVSDRQTANAAQALCDNLDSQDIDDMYVKLSFVVADKESVINPIPSEVTKGSKLTISGTTNVGDGVLVTVEMIASAFAAVPKETVGSASFISLTTTTDKDGNWEVTFDTTGLNVDEYTVSAAVGQLGSATAKVNVIEGAPTQQPTTTPTTTPTQEQPTETPVQTPGFGALAALAGLGAVAVLLLRRE